MKNLCRLTCSILLFALQVPGQLAQARSSRSAQNSASSAKTGRTADEQKLIAAARARAAAFAAGDCKTWQSYVSADFNEIEASLFTPLSTIVKQCQQNGDHKQERELSDFHFKFIGDIAVVDYRYDTIDYVGELKLTESGRQVDTWQERKGKWVAVVVVWMPIFDDPPEAKLDPATLDQFTGRYVWIGAPGIVDTVTRKGDKLYVQSSPGDDAPRELIRESADTFALHGTVERITFLRDRNGRVIEEYPHSPDGKGIHTKKIE